eukprot:TRINITY_DN11122_c0_g1_i1.p1 TRINITY_DN11122_c0_g1~~TRINITY_DN11122_c0_g1_i1.p1  ORF type:complete len:985 (-),score=123.04 TRINITY_DN11122_c0_g1_i1:2042-4609(-)
MQEKPQKKKFWGYTGGTVLIYVTTVIGGLLIGLFAHFIAQITSTLTSMKNEWNEHLLEIAGHSDLIVVLKMFGVQAAYSSVLVMIASLLVVCVAPVAIGAGVTLVMQYLNGSYVHNLFSWKTLAAKVFGTAFAVGSNVPIGPEGPMVHVGAALNYRLLCLNFTKMGQFIHRIFPCCNADCLKDPLQLHDSNQPKIKGRGAISPIPVSTDEKVAVVENGVTPVENIDEELEVIEQNNFCRTWDSLQTDYEHTEIVAAGAGAGLAAAFGSPIGGVLYSFEEASTYFGKKTLWRALICAVIAVYILQTVRNASYPGLIELNSVTDSYSMAQWMQQTPMLIITSFITALMGSLYIKLREYFNDVRRKMGLLKHSNRGWRIPEVIILTVIFIFVAYCESIMFGQCVPGNGYPEQYVKKSDLFNLKSVCGRGVLDYDDPNPKGYNDLLTLFFGIPEDTIKALIGVGTGETERYSLYSCLSLLVFSFTYLVFMALISSAAIPAGLFMPSIMIGGAFGLAFGQFLEIFWQQMNLEPIYPLGSVQPGLYALVGATSTLGGLFRASISLIVIIIEGTRGIDYIYGVLLAVLISNLVAKILHKEGVYETEIEKRGDIHHLRHDPPRALYQKKVEDIMQSSLTVLTVRPSLRQVMHVLQKSSHNGFPVVSTAVRNYDNQDHNEKHGKLEGMILRSQLMVLVDEEFYCDSEGTMLDRQHRDNYWKYGRILDYEMRHYFFKRHQAARIRYNIQAADSTIIDLDNTFVDLAVFMHRRPVCVTEGSYASSAHTQFVALRMRHMPVVDKHYNLVGLITRKDLDQAAGHGHWRHNPAPNPSPATSSDDNEIDKPLLGQEKEGDSSGGSGVRFA